MKRDFKQVLKDFNGAPLLMGTLDKDAFSRALGSLEPEVQLKVMRALQAENIRPLTLEAACCQALAADLPDERDPRGVATVTADERMRRWRLGTLLVCPGPDGTVEITPEQRDLIKGLLPKAWGGSLIAPQAMEMLEEAAPGLAVVR
jgi:hypothetical protein